MKDILLDEVPKELIEKRDSLKQEAKAMEKDFSKVKNKYDSTRYSLFSANVDIAKAQVEEVLNMNFWAFHDCIMDDKELNTKLTLERYYLAIVKSIGKELLLLNFLQHDGNTFINKSELPRTFEEMVKYLHNIEYDF